MASNDNTRNHPDVDSSLQREIDEALGGRSIEDIVENEEKKRAIRGGRRGGNVIAGTVVATNGPDIFVDYGGRGEGLLSTDQFSSDQEIPSEGDEVRVVIEGFDKDAGLMRLSREGRATVIDWDSLELGQVVEGMVVGLNSGGLELKIRGMRAFMPVSQVDIGHVDDLEEFLNTKIQAIIQEVDRGGKNMVVSRKELQQKIRAEQAEETWKSIHEGRVISGTVTNVMPYGAFVDIGGIDGLLHVRDMSHGRVEKPGDIVREGQKLEVKILNIDHEKKKIGLGLKQAQSDPWDGASIRWTVDSIIEGKVTKTTDFGAFVELEPGIEGLVHISELSEKRVASVKAEVTEGKSLRARVLSVDETSRRISLSVKQLEKRNDSAGLETGSLDDLEAVNRKKRSGKDRMLKGGLGENGGVDTPFGKLNIG